MSGDKGLVTELKDVRKELGDAARDVRDSTRIAPALKKDLKGIAGDISAAARETPARETPAPEPKQGETVRDADKESRS